MYSMFKQNNIMLKYYLEMLLKRTKQVFKSKILKIFITNLLCSLLVMLHFQLHYSQCIMGMCVTLVVIYLVWLQS